MSLLKKTATGQWVNREGFVGAIILKWNPADQDGKKHYRFLASPFDTIAHDIVENGVDDAVLISQDMLSTLVSRGVARQMTDAEAEAANANHDEDIESINDENTLRQVQVAEENKKEKEKPLEKIDPSKPVPPVILPQPPVQDKLEGEKSQLEQSSNDKGKKGK